VSSSSVKINFSVQGLSGRKSSPAIPLEPPVDIPNTLIIGAVFYSCGKYYKNIMLVNKKLSIIIMFFNGAQ